MPIFLRCPQRYLNKGTHGHLCTIYESFIIDAHSNHCRLYNGVYRERWVELFVMRSGSSLNSRHFYKQEFMFSAWLLVGLKSSYDLLKINRTICYAPWDSDSQYLHSRFVVVSLTPGNYPPLLVWKCLNNHNHFDTSVYSICQHCNRCTITTWKIVK